MRYTWGILVGKCYNYTYCRVFTPCKNCNIETRSRDYATVDEAVFPPWWAEPSRDEPTRISSPRLLPGNSYKHLDNAIVGKGHVTASAVTQQLKCFPACLIKGLQEFAGVVIGEFSGADSRGRFGIGEEKIVWIDDLKCDMKTSCVL
jgi:hypothetical protein